MGCVSESFGRAAACFVENTFRLGQGGERSQARLAALENEGLVLPSTQGVALGCIIPAFQADEKPQEMALLVRLTVRTNFAAS
jgi:hypothetical protein